MNAGDNESVIEAPQSSPRPGIAVEDGFVPRCPHCDYILLGLTVERCPECGRRFSLAQLRQMHLRRKPTPWEDPEYRRSGGRRYFSTCRAMLRPPFFLFLARPMRARRAIWFAGLTLLLVALLWIGVACAEFAYFGGSFGRRGFVLFDFFDVEVRLRRSMVWGLAASGSGSGPVEKVAGLAVSGVVFVIVTYLSFVLLLRAGLVLLSPASLASRNKTVVRQVVAYLSCWFLAGLAVFVVGVAARMLVDTTLKSLYVPMDFMFPVIAMAEVVLITVWCCHADAAVRDGLEGKSKSFGPILILLVIPLSLVFGGLLAWAIVLGLVGLL